MSQKQDPRKTPGPDTDPSDAFLDALTERAAADAQESRANGGRVIDSVFNDPIVRAALGDYVPQDRYKEQRAALLAKRDALLRQQRLDDNAYFERSKKAQRKILLKHSFSGAQDSQVAIEIDHEKKAIYIETEPGRISVSQIAHYILHSVDLGTEVTFDDDTGEGYQCRRTAWRIVIWSGEQTYRLVITKQKSSWDYDLRVEPKE